jgi:predicted permease
MSRGKRMLRDLEQAIREHIEMETQDNIGRGLSPEDARAAAMRKFGNVTRVKEETREVWSLVWLDRLGQDLRFGLRMLRNSPGFTAIALVTIALGIAANVSVFSFVDALFLRTVPAKDPAGLVRLTASGVEGSRYFSYPEYAYIRDHAKTLQMATAHYSTAPFYVTVNGSTGEVQGAVVSSGYFDILGLRPYLGRFFTPADDSVPDRDAVAVVGFGFWQRAFGGSPNVAGKFLSINGKAFEVVGVMPRDFHGVEIGGMPNEIWIPSMMLRTGYRGCGFDPDCTFLRVMGRLAPGRDFHEAGTEITELLRQLQSSGQGFERRSGVTVEPAIGVWGRSRDYFRMVAALLAGIGGLLMVIVCANLGGLLIARGTARRSEIAMRLALGAGRWRIVRQLLTESLLLASAGGALGLVMSLWTSRLLMSFYSVDDEGYFHWFDLHPGASVIGYSIAIALTAGLLFGLLPAWLASGADLNEMLKSGVGSQASSGSRIRSLLVTTQVALSLALLVGASLLTRSARQLEAGASMDLHRVLGLRLRPALLEYSPSRAHGFTRDVLQRLGELPGVESVSLAKGQGLVWAANQEIHVALPGSYARTEDEPVVHEKQVAPNFFATLRIPFLGGRDFNDHDRVGTPLVGIVNETLARRISPNTLPLGQTVMFDDKSYQIVGVVQDAEIKTIFDAPIPVVYRAFWQDDKLIDSRLCVRVAGDPTAALPKVRSAIAAIDSNVPITETMPLLDQVRGTYANTRVAGAVMSCAAGLALLLSAIGLFGVLSYEVGRRTREIGIRLAVGAQPKQIVALFLRQGLTLVAVGCLAGGSLAWAASRLLGAWLVGIRPHDPLTLGGAVAFLLMVGALACYIPARRAMRVDPLVALRCE